MTPLRRLLIFAPLMLLIALIALGGYVGYTYYNSPSLRADRESAELIKVVSRLIELPSGTPQIATVSDVTQLKNQPFFARAQNGDKVLIYPSEKKAILYRPSTKKIVDAGPVQINTATPSAQTQTPATIAYVNGTTTSGLAGQVEEAIQKNFQSTQTSAKLTSENQYKETIIVDITGNPLVSPIAQLLKGRVSKTLPSEISVPKGTDIVVIIGQQ